jgi:hypothetical protein
MDLNQKLSDLYNINSRGVVHIGRSFKIFNQGVIRISKDEDHWEVVHSTHENRHITPRGGADPFSVEFRDNSAVSAFILTSSQWLKDEKNSWWKTEDPDVTKKLGALMIEKIDMAYANNFPRR